MFYKKQNKILRQCKNTVDYQNICLTRFWYHIRDDQVNDFAGWGKYVFLWSSPSIRVWSYYGRGKWVAIKMILNWAQYLRLTNTPLFISFCDLIF